MPDYNETTLTGTAWQRCHQITVHNVRNAPPSVEFAEERVIALQDGAEIRQQLGALAVPYNPAKVISLRDPATGELTAETATYAQAYQILYSAYIDAALERDASITPPTPPQTPEQGA